MLICPLTLPIGNVHITNSWDLISHRGNIGNVPGCIGAYNIFDSVYVVMYSGDIYHYTLGNSLKYVGNVEFLISDILCTLDNIIILDGLGTYTVFTRNNDLWVSCVIHNNVIGFSGIRYIRDTDNVTGYSKLQNIYWIGRDIYLEKSRIHTSDVDIHGVHSSISNHSREPYVIHIFSNNDLFAVVINSDTSCKLLGKWSDIPTYIDGVLYAPNMEGILKDVRYGWNEYLNRLASIGYISGVRSGYKWSNYADDKLDNYYTPEYISNSNIQMMIRSMGSVNLSICGDSNIYHNSNLITNRVICKSARKLTHQ